MERLHTTLADQDIRPILRSHLRKNACETDSVMLEELGLCRGRVRIDVAVVNGSFCGYEIKSDRDSLRRLAEQVEFYNKVLDQATLVVGERHIREAVSMIPEWWGILCVDPTYGAPRLNSLRAVTKNPKRDPRALVELLWLENAIALLEAHGAARGIKGKPRRVVWDRVCEHFQIDEIAAAVRAHLKTRATQKDPLPRS
jgi:hypothetical protein